MNSLFSSYCVTKYHTDFFLRPITTNHRFFFALINIFHANCANLNSTGIDFVPGAVQLCIVGQRKANDLRSSSHTSSIRSKPNAKVTFLLPEIYLQMQRIRNVFLEKRSHLVYFIDSLIQFASKFKKKFAQLS